MASQWEEMPLPSHQRATNIVTQLRKGIPPPEDVALFSTGRTDLLNYFDSVLNRIAADALQDVKFIQADYGHGKTHFLDMLAQLALSKRFVVSVVSLDRETAPFNKLEKVVPLIMSKLMTPNKGQGRGLGSTLEEWAAKVAGLDRNRILRTLDESENLPLLFPDFRLKLADYAGAFNRSGGPAYEECLKAEKWFRGEESKAKTFQNVQDYLAAFVQFVRYLGYSGFVVMLDEAESITLLSRITNRDQANENLRQIIDNPELQGFYFVFASTPSFLGGEDDRGAKSYPALWRRIRDPLGQIGQKALDKVIVELPSLSTDEFAQLARRIKQIYTIAYERPVDQVQDAHLLRLAEHVRVRADKSLRTLVRSTVMLLDEARNGPDFDVVSNYELLVERIMQDEERARTA